MVMIVLLMVNSLFLKMQRYEKNERKKKNFAFPFILSCLQDL